jgi:hypothetical protein
MAALGGGKWCRYQQRSSGLQVPFFQLPVCLLATSLMATRCARTHTHSGPRAATSQACTFPSLCAQQEVSAPHWQATFHCLDQSLVLHLSRGECPSLASFLLPVQPFCIGMVGECARGDKDGHMVPPPRIPTECKSKCGARSAWEG